MNARARTRSAARLSLAVGGVLIAGAALTGCGGADADGAEPEYKAFALAGRELSVDSDNSGIELVPGDGKEVKVTRWFDGWSVGGSSPKATWEVDGNTLKLREHCSGIGSHCQSKHRIEVPRGVKVTVKDDNGRVTASGFETDLEIHSSNGEVHVTDSTGALDLFSSNGNVIATDTGARRVRARSDNGNVRIALSRVPDRVETSNKNGNITITVPRGSYDVDGHSKNGNVTVDVPSQDGNPHTITGHNTNGNVKVTNAN
ncbi:DUF4097 family beta strand repeat-containing protein [Streptomyces sp. ISL-11]|uniref:DUF4097 family beta strand repeat-containing protein n=1 Tax=Streptomyces sp. ISL-11 TaxID=2819174 RepID=UPI001BEC7D9A|nr:DUF4097 family beta strand repeat-containing protein [Streptomyces sp. ISL-11]MBT2383659.1 DUF4097 family beta strand repeat protein [Streptomyces sp. ISL-11]